METEITLNPKTIAVRKFWILARVFLLGALLLLLSACQAVAEPGAPRQIAGREYDVTKTALIIGTDGVTLEYTASILEPEGKRPMVTFTDVAYLPKGAAALGLNPVTGPGQIISEFCNSSLVECSVHPEIELLDPTEHIDDFCSIPGFLCAASEAEMVLDPAKVLAGFCSEMATCAWDKAALRPESEELLSKEAITSWACDLSFADCPSEKKEGSVELTLDAPPETILRNIGTAEPISITISAPQLLQDLCSALGSNCKKADDTFNKDPAEAMGSFCSLPYFDCNLLMSEKTDDRQGDDTTGNLLERDICSLPYVECAEPSELPDNKILVIDKSVDFCSLPYVKCAEPGSLLENEITIEPLEDFCSQPHIRCVQPGMEISQSSLSLVLLVDPLGGECGNLHGDCAPLTTKVSQENPDKAGQKCEATQETICLFVSMAEELNPVPGIGLLTTMVCAVEWCKPGSLADKLSSITGPGEPVEPPPPPDPLDLDLGDFPEVPPLEQCTGAADDGPCLVKVGDD